MSPSPSTSPEGSQQAKEAGKKPPFPRFRGMMPILPTAIDAHGDLDEASQRRLVQYCLKCEAAAIGHFGFASEHFKLSPGDRRKLTTWIVDEAAGRVPVFIGVTAPSNRIVLEHAREARDLGADLLMAASPYVYAPDADGYRSLYQQVSDAAGLPIIIQDTPASAPVLDASLLERIWRETEHVHYVKAEGKDFLQKGAEVHKRTRGGLEVIGGFGGKRMLHMLRLGITSFMTGTEALDIHGGIVRAFMRGDAERAADIYFNRFMPYFEFYDAYPDELLKKMLHMRGVIDCPAQIEPYQTYKPMSDIEWEEFNWVLDRIGYLDSRWPDIKIAD